VIVDDRLAWLMTMNLTVSGSEMNREDLVEDREPADVAEATAFFDADSANRAYIPSGSLVVSPNNSTQRLVALVASAVTLVGLEGESLSDTDDVNALVAAKRHDGSCGARERPVPATAQRLAIVTVKAAQFPVVAYGSESARATRSAPHVHAKLILVDGREGYVGSANVTTNGLDSNRELGVLVREPGAVPRIAATFDGDFRTGRAL
jgi:hypothetical protein